MLLICYNIHCSDETIQIHSRSYRLAVDTADKEGVIGRSHWDAPEIDGNVYLVGEAGLESGDHLEVFIEDSDAYDLWAVRGRKPVLRTFCPVGLAIRDGN